MKSREKVVTLCEGAVCVALSVILSYIKIDTGAYGGSINFAMIPLIVFAVYRGGLFWGFGAGLVYGILHCLLDGGVAIAWTSILLDYAVAFAAVGFAGIFCGKGPLGYLFGALTGCVARFIIHFISGVTIYAIYAESVYAGISTPTPFIYSLVYNALYMLPNTITAVVLCYLIGLSFSRISFMVNRQTKISK